MKDYRALAMAFAEEADCWRALAEANGKFAFSPSKRNEAARALALDELHKLGLCAFTPSARDRVKDGET